MATLADALRNKNMDQSQFQQATGAGSRERITGLLADLLSPAQQYLNKYKIPQSFPLLGEQSAADLTGLTGTQGLLNDFSNNKNVTGDMRMFDAMGMIPAIGPAIKGVGLYSKLAGNELAKQVETGTGLIGRNIIDPRMNIVSKDIYNNIEKSNNSTIPKVPVGNIFKNNIAEIPDNIKNLFNNVDLKSLPSEIVDTLKIFPTQKNININNLKSVNGLNYLENSPTAIKYGDNYYLTDGHHRVANDILENKLNSNLKVFDSNL